MSARTGGHQNVRARIALLTREIHDALHHDAVLGRLTAPDLTPQCYRTALAVLQKFYHAIEGERRRADRWPDLSLQSLCAALDEDLGPHVGTAPALVFDSEDALLGGLYVAHGASFGRASFRANVTARLPQVSQRFIGQRIDKGVWQRLTGLMEDRGSNDQAVERIGQGAEMSFAHVAVLSSRSRTHFPASGLPSCGHPMIDPPVAWRPSE